MIRSLKLLYHLGVAIFANIWFGFPSRKLTVLGVTGTDGKTTTTSLIYHILTSTGVKASMITSVHAVIAGKSYDTGFHVTTPSAWQVQQYLAHAVRHGDTHIVLEVTSHGLSQHRVWGVFFRVGVITNVTHEHLDWHGTFENYRKTKLSLLSRSTIAVINRDEDELYSHALPILVRKKYITYGVRRDAAVTLKTYKFTSKLIGEFNTYNILAALAATVDGLGIGKLAACRAVATFPGVAGRMETVYNKSFRVIVDFAHTPAAIEVALKTARELNKKGRLIHIFGSAGLRDASKRPLMGQKSAKYADIIILTEEDYRTEKLQTIMDAIAAGIPKGKEVHRFENRQEAITYGISRARPGDTVIMTGKAHEKSLCRGKTEYPWSEHEAVRKALESRKS